MIFFRYASGGGLVNGHLPISVPEWQNELLKKLLSHLKKRFMLQPQAKYSTVIYYPLEGKPEPLARELNRVGQ
jgi:hypothetical protein